MISVLLLSLALAGGPGETRVAAPVPPAPDDPAIRIWLSDDGRYLRGDHVKVEVRTRNDGYLLVLHVDPDGRLRVLFPLDPTDDNFVRGGRRFEIVGRGDRRAFTTDAGTGHGTVYAAVSRDPFRFEGFVAGDHWDFRALNDVRISRDVEADLNDFVRRLAVSDFDYDIVGYDVYRDLAELRGYDRYGGTTYVTYAWPGWYSPWWSSAWWYDPWCWGWPCRPFFGGTSVFIGISFGHPHRFFFRDPFFFDPFFFDPFFVDAFFFDPFFFHHGLFFHRPFVAGAFVFPLRPFRPRSPFFWRPPLGGQFATPWRPRWDGATYAGSGTWQGRTFPGVQYVPGQLASAQGRRPGVQPVSAVRERSFDMTPGRVEARRPQVTVARDPDRSPEARRPPERREPGAAPLPRPITEPRRLPEAHAAESRPALPRDVSPGRADDAPGRVDDSPVRVGDDPGERGMRRSLDLPRRVEPREPEAHRVEPRAPDRAAPEARPAPRAPEARPFDSGRLGGEARPQIERGRAEPARAQVTREAAEWRAGDAPRGGGFRGRALGGGRHGGGGGWGGGWGGGRGGGRR